MLGDATFGNVGTTPTIDSTPTPVTTLSGEPMPTSGNELPLIILPLLGVTLFLEERVYSLFTRQNDTLPLDAWFEFQLFSVEKQA